MSIDVVVVDLFPLACEDGKGGKGGKEGEDKVKSGSSVGAQHPR